MANYHHIDVVSELVELSRDLTNDIRQQLTYYRASVYKDETAKNIKGSVENLRLIASILGTEMLMDVFRDHDAIMQKGGNQFLPGECAFSARTTMLINGLETQLDQIVNAIYQNDKENLPSLSTSNLKKNRRQILSVCRHGSRQWSFFQTL